jgi:hypothetical protein
MVQNSARHLYRSQRRLDISKIEAGQLSLSYAPSTQGHLSERWSNCFAPLAKQKDRICVRKLQSLRNDTSTSAA